MILIREKIINNQEGGEWVVRVWGDMTRDGDYKVICRTCYLSHMKELEKVWTQVQGGQL